MATCKMPATFEDYCRERWHKTRRWAYYLIDAASVVQNVSNWGHEPPANEAQTRPLAKLEPEQQPKAWAEVLETAPEGEKDFPTLENVYVQQGVAHGQPFPQLAKKCPQSTQR